jgi:hypothetical protein
MTSVELRKLNAYPEWRNDNKINAVIQYVQAIQNNNPNPPINLQLYPTKDKSRHKEFWQLVVAAIVGKWSDTEILKCPNT